jgi:hypothetical protein
MICSWGQIPPELIITFSQSGKMINSEIGIRTATISVTMIDDCGQSTGKLQDENYFNVVSEVNSNSSIVSENHKADRYW